MSESKHTKGPWKVHRDNADKWYTRRVYADGDDLIANVLHGHEGNACLIAAAPDLLEALQALLAAVKTVPEMNRQCFDQVGIQVNAAIAKAKEGK